MSLIFVGLYVVLAIMFAVGSPGWLNYSLLCLFVDQQLYFFPAIYWILANDMTDMSQAKRLFPLIASFGVVGDVVGLGDQRGRASRPEGPRSRFQRPDLPDHRLLISRHSRCPSAPTGQHAANRARADHLRPRIADRRRQVRQRSAVVPLPDALDVRHCRRHDDHRVSFPRRPPSRSTTRWITSRPSTASFSSRRRSSPSGCKPSSPGGSSNDSA